MARPLLWLLCLTPLLVGVDGCEEEKEAGPTDGVEVLAAEGKVMKGGSGRPVSAGDHLAPGDELHVGSGSHAVLYGVKNRVVARIEAGVSAQVGSLIFLQLPRTEEPVAVQVERLLRPGEEMPQEQLERLAGWHARSAAAQAVGAKEEKASAMAVSPPSQVARDVAEAEAPESAETAQDAEIAGPEGAESAPRGGGGRVDARMAADDDRLVQKKPQKKPASERGVKTRGVIVAPHVGKSSGGGEDKGGAKKEGGHGLESSAAAHPLPARVVQVAGTLSPKTAEQALALWAQQGWSCSVKGAVRVALELKGSTVEVLRVEGAGADSDCVTQRLAALRFAGHRGRSVLVIELGTPAKP